MAVLIVAGVVVTLIGGKDDGAGEVAEDTTTVDDEVLPNDTTGDTVADDGTVVTIQAERFLNNALEVQVSTLDDVRREVEDRKKDKSIRKI